MDKRSLQIDADMAATDADMAEADATAAIDYAAWTIDNARLAVLDAIDARGVRHDARRHGSLVAVEISTAHRHGPGAVAKA
jgi:hypothetical protein